MSTLFYIVFLFIQISVDPVVKVAAGSVSTDKTEFAFAVSPDSSMIFFVRSGSFYTPAKRAIYKTSMVDKEWSKPALASFSGEYSDSGPFFTYDGNWLYFTSDRPTDRQHLTGKNIWRIPIKNKVLGSPELVEGVNSPKSEYSLSVDGNGNLYFGSTRDSLNWGNIYVAKRNGDGFHPPEALPGPVNTPDGEWGSCISKDGKTLIFESNGREENITYDGDLFIAQKEGLNWSVSHLPINSNKSDLTPKLFYANSGLKLFFASNRNAGNIDSNDVDIYMYDLNKYFNEN